MKSTVAREIALLLSARQNCINSGNTAWLGNHTSRLTSLVRNHMPSGSGIDSGTTLDIDASTPDKLVFHTSFHHMDEHGSYDGWTEHAITVRPSLAFGLTLTIGGRNRNDIKEYLSETFTDALRAEIDLPTAQPDVAQSA